MKKSGILFLGLLLVPSLASANVVINEIAWMGSKVESVDSSKWQYYEWIELYNNGNDTIDLTGWILSIVGKKDISLENTIPANGYYFIERSGYHAFDNITVDLVTSFGTGLPNSGATLVLKDAGGNPIDTVDGSDNWKIGGGDIMGNNTTKETAQRISSGWITATATPRAANASVSELPPEQQSQQSQSQSSSSGSSSSSSSSSYTPPEKLPKIKAYAGEDKTVTVGANVEFRGQAFGLKDEPLTNARYLWVFGDGASKEGKNITHVYQYPGEYIVSLNVSSGEYSASDYLLIKAVPNQVFISEIKTGANGWIELKNKSKEEIDISGCQIKYNDQNFIFPQSTRMRPGAYLVIPSSVSGIIFYDGKGIVELLYAGGFKADIFNYDGFLSENESFNRIDTGSLISLATPGAKNSTPTLSRVEASTSSIDNSAPLAKAPEEIRASKSTDQKSQNQDNTQTANMITVGDNGAKSNTTIYLIAIIGVILFASAAILFIRRHRGI